MSNAMHVAKTGLNAQNSRMQVIANNLANVNTTGYSGSIGISGLPLTVKNTGTSEPFMGMVYNKDMISSAGETLAICDKNDTTIFFVDMSTSTFARLAWGTVGGGRYMRVQVMYIPA